MKPTGVEPKQSLNPSGLELLGLGGLLAGAVLIPLLLGLAADTRLNSSPVGVILGMLLGIVAAVWVMFVRFRRYW